MLLIKNARIASENSPSLAEADVLVSDGKIQNIGQNLTADADTRVIDARGRIVMPAMFDAHVHFREPGFEGKETIASGSESAINGGITGVVMMPNTKPAIDNAGMVEFVNRRARETACIEIRPGACATKGMQGKEITEMAELAEAVGQGLVVDHVLAGLVAEEPGGGGAGLRPRPRDGQRARPRHDRASRRCCARRAGSIWKPTGRSTPPT